MTTATLSQDALAFPRRPRRPAVSLADVPARDLALALRTQSLRAVARYYGVSRNTVRSWRETLGIPGPPGPAPRGPTLQPQILQVLQAHPSGLRQAELACHVAASSVTCYRVLRQLEATGQISRTLEPIPGRWQTRSRWHAPAFR